MSIERIEESQLRTMNGKEGIILQGCGGEASEWLDGVNRMFQEANILRNGSKFDKCYVFSHNDHTCMLFPFEITDLDVGRLAMWRLQNYEIFGGTWLSDYVPNKLGGFIEENTESVRAKPKCALIGEDGNIFNLMGIASKRYIEVFGGAGWVLFHKPPGMDFEVYNDFNSNLTNLYRCVRGNPNKLKYKLRYILNSREDFDIVAMLHKRGLFHRLKDYDRAAKFYQLVRFSYASGLDSFGSQPHSLWADFPMIDLAARRLQKVVIENKDFEKLIRQYDRPVSFFYCDPPYFNTESYYKDVGFTRQDHIRLMNALISIKGKFLVS